MDSLIFNAQDIAGNDIYQAIQLISQSIAKGNKSPGARTILNTLANQLLSVANAETDRAMQMKAYEILSTLPDSNISVTARNKKMALDFADQADEKFNSGDYLGAIRYSAQANQLYGMNISHPWLINEAVKNAMDNTTDEGVRQSIKKLVTNSFGADAIPDEFK